jgi:hypothetical protein
MAIGRITGQMLSANLARSGTDLAFETNLLVLDVTNSRIGIGTASPATTLHVSATDALRLPSGNTAQRPGSPANGDIRYNSTTAAVEGYAGGWLKMTGGTSLADADSDTQIEVERSTDEDAMHFQTDGVDRAHIRSNGNIELNNLQIANMTVSTLATNGDLTLTPNGTGKVIVTDGTTLQTNTADINGGAIDGAIIGANSAAAGTFTTLNTSSNAVIGGNLTVSGTTTTVSTTNTTIADNIIELNSGISQSLNDSGLIIERGSTGNNAAILWDESADKFTMGTTTATAADKSGGITVALSTLVANLEATTATLGGSDIISTDNTKTLTNKTIDANGTGNAISNIDIGNMTAAVVVLESEGIASNDNDTTLPTSASVKDYVDTQDAAIAGDTLTFTNKTIDANGTGNSITNLDSGNLLSGFLKDEDDMTSNSATSVASQQSIKAYVDAQDAAIASDTLTLTNKTIDANGTGNAISNIDSGNMLSGFFLDEDNMATNSATAVASQQSIKAYVDAEVSAVSTTAISQGNSSATVSDTGSDGAFTVVADGNTELVINDTSATFSGNVIMSGNLTVNGTTTTVATTNTTISDNIIELNSGISASSNDAGIIIERGSTGNNAFIGWDESADKFTVGTTTATAGDKSGGISVTAGTLVANLEGNVTGNVTGQASDISNHLLDEDNMATDSATKAPSQQSVKAYVDAQDAAIAGDTLTFTNKTIDANGTGNAISNIDSGNFLSGFFLDEDDLNSDSATSVASQQSIKAYVDAQVTAQDLDFACDDSTTLSIDLDSESLQFSGGTGITTAGTGNTVTVAIDGTVATLTGSQTLTNKTLTSPVLNTGVSGTAVKDEDNMASDSATHLATQQSIKAYVDAEVGAVSTTSITQGNTSAAVTDTGSDGAFTVTADGNTELVVNDTSATFSGNVIVSGDFTVNGTTTTIDSTTLTVEDPMITLAKNNSGGDANTFDQGLFFNRGSLANVSFLWDESTDQFAAAVTSGEDGTTAGNVTIDSYAAMRMGVTTVSDLETGSISAADGTAAATIANSTGVVTVPSAVLTTADINGGTVDGVTIGGASAGAGTFTTLVAANTQTGTVKANDGTAAIAIADSTGVVTVPSAVLTTADINGGTADGVTIGGSTAAAGTFTTLIAANTQTGTVKANDGTAAIAIADSTGVVTISTAVELDGGNVTINESSASVDFRVESNGHAHALFVDGSEDHVGIKTATPAYDLDLSGSTDAMRMPNGTTGQRPTGATGIIRFNTTTGNYEGCQDGSTFVNFAFAGDTPTFTKESTTGDGSTTTFTGFFSSAPESANNVFVYIDNVFQEPTENYTVSGTNITFTSAPHSAARIFAITGADNTALASGGIARTEASSTNFTSSATTIMSFNASSYRSAELFIQLTDTANTEYAAMKGVVVHNGTTAFITIHGITNTGSTDLGTITAVYDSGTVNVQAVSTGGVTAGKVQYSLSAV